MRRYLFWDTLRREPMVSSILVIANLNNASSARCHAGRARDNTACSTCTTLYYRCPRSLPASLASEAAAILDLLLSTAFL